MAKLSIDVEAKTGKASGEIKKLEKDLAGLETHAAGIAKTGSAFDKLAAGAKLSTAANVAQAASMAGVASATTKAGAAAAAAQSRFASLGRVFATLGTKLHSELSSALSTLPLLGGRAGTALGSAIGHGILAGLRATPVVGTIVALVALASAGLSKLANKLGKEFSETFAAALKAGTDVKGFQQFAALGTALTGSAEGGKQFATAMGAMQKTLRAGGEDADKLTKALKEINIDPKKLASDNLSVAVGEFEQLAAAAKNLDPQRFAGMMNKLFESMDPATLGKLGETFQKTSPQIATMLNEVQRLNEVNQKTAEQGKAAGGAFDDLSAAFGRLGVALNSALGLTKAYDAAVGLAIATTKGLTTIIDSLTALVEGRFNDAFGGIPKKVGDAFSGLADIVASKLAAVTTAIAAKGQEWTAALLAAVSAIGAAAAAIGKAIYDGILNGMAGLAEAIVAKIKAAIAAATPDLSGGRKFDPQGSNAPYALPQFVGGLAPGASMMPSIYGAGGASIISPIRGFAAGGMSSFDQLFLGTAAAANASTAAIKANTAAKVANKAATDASTKSEEIYKLTVAQVIAQLNTQTSTATQNTLEIQKLSAALASGKLNAEGFRVATEKLTAAQQKSGGEAKGFGASMKNFQEGLKSWSDSAADALANAIVNGEDLGDVLKNLVKQLAAMALKTLVLKPLFESIFGAVGGFSPVEAGGSITGAAANDSIGGFAVGSLAQASASLAAAGRASARAARAGGGGNVTNTLGSLAINFNSAGPDVEGDTERAKNFGRQVRAIVQREMVQQSRPGGILRERAA